MQFFTEDGHLQFDVKSSAFGFVGKGTLIATDHWSGAPWAIGSNPTGTFAVDTLAYAFDLVFFRCTDAVVLPANRPYSSDPPNTIRVYTQVCAGDLPVGHPYYGDTTEKTGLMSHSVDYWCFRSMRWLTPPSGGVGLRLFNADGTLAYDSSLLPVKVVHNNFVGSMALSGFASPTHTLADPANTAIMKFGTSADGIGTFLGGGMTQMKYRNQGVKNTPTGYARQSYFNLFPFGVPVTSSSPILNIWTGGFVGVDVSTY